MICQSCGIYNPPQSKFCNQCGSQLLVVPGQEPEGAAVNSSRIFLLIGVTAALVALGAVLFFYMVQQK